MIRLCVAMARKLVLATRIEVGIGVSYKVVLDVSKTGERSVRGGCTTTEVVRNEGD